MNRFLSVTMLAVFVIITQSAHAQDISFSGLKFRTKTMSLPGGSIKRLEDSTWIGYDAQVFKSLLFTTSRIELDTAGGNQMFNITAPFTLMAKVGDGSYQAIWQINSPGVISINANDLASGVGYTFTSTGSNITVSGMPFTVNKIYFEGQPATPSTNNSYVSANGVFTLPETGGKITHALTGTNRVSIYDTANISLAFDVPVDTTFSLKQISFKTDGMQFQYDLNAKQFSLYGKAVMTVDSAKISCTLGNSAAPGISFANGSVDKISLQVQDSFQLHAIKLTPQSAGIYYSKPDDEYKMYGAFDLEVEQEKISIQVGDTVTPGCTIKNGKIDQFLGGVQGTFKLKGLAFRPNPLYFNYNAADTLYEIYGTAQIGIQSDSIDITAGDAVNPGLLIQDGLLQNVNLGVTADFNLKGLSLHPKNTTLNYSRVNDQFSIYGSLDATFSGNTIDVELGNANAPGLVIDKATLDVSSIDMTTTDTFKLYSLILEPNTFHFEYDKTAGRYELWGTMDALVGQDTIHMQMGDAANPGLLLNNGTLQQLQMGITTNFKLFGLELDPQNLTCTYNSASGNHYTIYGQLDAMFDGDTIHANLGTLSAPGLNIKNGAITNVDLGVNGNFKIAGAEFIPQNFTFHYDNSNNYYEMYGALDVKADSDNISIVLGDSNNPGCIIHNGSLLQLNATIDSTFKLKGLAFTPAPLNFVYSKADNQYEIFGNARLGISTDTLDLSLGNAANPGILVKDGILEDINLGITADFKLRGLGVHPKNTTINYTKANNQFIMYGTLDASFDGNVINLDMGTVSDPGLKINTATGKLAQLNLTTTDTFKLYSLTLEPDSFHFEYNAQDDKYGMWGKLNAILSTDTIAILMGNAANPGLSLNSGVLERLNFGITADFKLAGLEIKANQLTATYKGGANKEYTIYGEIDAKFENNTLDANLGNASNPGWSIQNGEIESVNIGIDGDFKIAALTFSPKDLTFHYDKGNNYYEMYGSMDFSLEGESISVDMGNESDPGLIVENGVLDQLNFGINSAFTLGGLEVETKGVGVHFTRANATRNYDHYLIKGETTVKELWSITADLGDPAVPTSGLELDIDGNGKSKVLLDGFVIQAKEAGVAGIGFNDIYAKYSKVGNDYKVVVDLDVSFPAGFEVAAGLAFEKNGSGKLIVDSIGIDFSATGGDPGIEIPETGIFIVELGGEISRTAAGDYSFGGIIALALGGNFSFDGKDCEMLRISGQVTIDKDHLDIIDKLYVAAYKNNGDWNGALGQGMVELDLDWSEGDYMAKGEIDVLGSPNTFVKFLTEADYHTNGSLSAMGEADLIVPDWIPIIGGKKLAQVDAAIRYKKEDLNNSEAAGWMKVNLLIKKITVGLEYNFGKKKVKKIGQSDVSNIESSVVSDADYKQLYYYNFDIAPNVNAITLNLKPKNTTAYWDFLEHVMTNAYDPNYNNWENIVLQTPDNNSTIVNINKEIGVAAFNFVNHVNVADPGAIVAPDVTIKLDSITNNGISLHFQTNTVDDGEALPTGKYSLYTDRQELLAVFDIELQQHYTAPETPLLELDNTHDPRSVTLNNTSRIYVADTPTICYYYNTAPDYNGAIFRTDGLPNNVRETIASIIDFTPPRDSVTVFDSVSAKWIRKPVSRNKQYYFYTVVRDGVSQPVFSNIAGPITLGPAINVAVVPQQTEFVDGEAVVWLNAKVSNPQTIDPRSIVTFYYDFDTMGYNGQAIPYMVNMPLNTVNNSQTEFVVSSVNDVRFRRGVYFYSMITTPSGEVLRMPYTSQPLKIMPPLQVNVSYYAINHGAAGVKVWLDGDNNGIFNGGPDIVLTTDNNGNCTFPYEWKSDITVGLILSSQLNATNPTAVLTKTIPAASNNTPSQINFTLNYPQVTVNGKFNMNYSDGGYYYDQINNYVFIDLNGNLIRESNEPAVMQDAGNSFSLTVNQPLFNLVYVDKTFSDHYNNLGDYVMTSGHWDGQDDSSPKQINNGNDFYNAYYIRIDQRNDPENYNLNFNFNANIENEY